MESEAIRQAEHEPKAWPPQSVGQMGLVALFAGLFLVPVGGILNQLYSMFVLFDVWRDFILFVLVFSFFLFLMHLVVRVGEYSLVAAKLPPVVKEEEEVEEPEEKVEEPKTKGKKQKAEKVIEKPQTGKKKNVKEEDEEETEEDGSTPNTKRKKKTKPGAKFLQQIAEQQKQLREEEAREKEREKERKKREALEELQRAEGEKASSWTGKHVSLNGKLTKPCPETKEMGPCSHVDLPPVMVALMHHDIEVAKDLVENTKDALAPQKDGTTVLSLALEEGQTRFAEWILTARNLKQEKVSKAATQADVDRQTPAMVAASKGFVRLVSLLADKGDDLLAKDVNGNTAMMLAAQSGNMSCVREIARRVGSRSSSELSRENSSKERPLCFAAAANFKSVVHYMSAMGARFGPDCANHPSCPDYLCDDSSCHKAHVDEGDIIKVGAKEAKKNARKCTWCGVSGPKKGMMACASCNGAYYCDVICMGHDTENHRPQCV
eukprot:comp21157_c0_seq1/m.28650 comp21157_c0_seq1/g.28650  ORF comp21157_c0_seq1/g.28650 comp21157_c0_seq1/m.28650 type:complete len:492 (-) comp21157_c0_seq1:1-1476(-)